MCGALGTPDFRLPPVINSGLAIEEIKHIYTDSILSKFVEKSNTLTKLYSKN